MRSQRDDFDNSKLLRLRQQQAPAAQAVFEVNNCYNYEDVQNDNGRINIWTTLYLVLQYHKEFLIIGYLELVE